MKRGITLGLGALALSCAILSARLLVPWIAYGVILVAVASMVLSAWDKLDSKTTPALVFALGLAFLWQTTLMSNGLIGTDIHTEYYIYNKTLTGGWDWSYPHSYNSSIGTTLIAPFLTRWLHIDGYTTYKYIFPFLFALVPLLLFYVWRKEFGEKVAFLSAIFFVTVPTYLMELIGLPREMLGELALTVVIFLLVLQPMRRRYLIPALVGTALLAYLFHYVMGPVALVLTLGCALVLALFRLLKHFGVKWFPEVRLPLKFAAMMVIVPAIIGMAYYSTVAQGNVASDLTSVTSWIVRNITGKAGVASLPPSANKQDSTPVTITPKPGLAKQEPVIRTALGLDFAGADTTGKIFRVLQLAVQVALVAGGIWIIKNRKKVSAEYIGLAAASTVLLAACVLIPRFTNMLNATRFYHIGMFLLAPLVILGGAMILRNVKTMTVVVLIPYLLFTTGAVFEATKQTDISKVNIPYSLALSSQRVSVVGVFTDNDMKVAKWIAAQDATPVFADINGMLLLSERMEPFHYRYTPGYKESEFWWALTDGTWGYLTHDSRILPAGSYAFLTEYNTEHRAMTYKPYWYAMRETGTGMRVDYSFDELHISDNATVVFSAGNAKVIRVGEGN